MEIVLVELQKVVNEKQTIDERAIEKGIQRRPGITSTEIQTLLERTIEKNVKKSCYDSRKYIEWLEEGSKYDSTDFLCPITQEVLYDPICFGGHIYNFDSLQEWFKHDPTCSSPLTRQTLSKKGKPLKIKDIKDVKYGFYRELIKFKKNHRKKSPTTDV
jgi:hypothetical protein